MTSGQDQSIPFAAQAIPFDEFLAAGKLPEGFLTSEYVAQQFVERLRAHGIPTTVRDTRGSDIDGACGQLAAATT